MDDLRKNAWNRNLIYQVHEILLFSSRYSVISPLSQICTLSLQISFPNTFRAKDFHLLPSTFFLPPFSFHLPPNVTIVNNDFSRDTILLFEQLGRYFFGKCLNFNLFVLKVLKLFGYFSLIIWNS